MPHVFKPIKSSPRFQDGKLSTVCVEGKNSRLIGVQSNTLALAGPVWLPKVPNESSSSTNVRVQVKPLLLGNLDWT